MSESNEGAAGANEAPNNEGTGAKPDETLQATGSQNGQGSGGEGDGGGDKSPLTEFEKRVQARAEEIAAEQIDSEIARREAERRENEADRLTSDALDQFLKDSATALKGVKFKTITEDGSETELTLSDQQIQDAVGKNFDKLRTELRNIEAQGLEDELAAAVATILPEAKHDAFAKDAQKAKDLNEWLEAVIEHAAPETKAFKAHGDAEYGRGFDDGVTGRTAGQVSSGQGRGESAVSAQGKSVLEQAQMIAAGSLDFEQEMARRLGRS